MRGKIVSLGLLAWFAFFLVLPVALQAQIELKEGMTQGDFALWIADAIGAKSKLPPAADGKDAIDFLTQLGSIPEDAGWAKDEATTKELLASLLEDPEEAANLSWDELVDKVREQIQEVFDERKLGTFRVVSSTPSLPAA